MNCNNCQHNIDQHPDVYAAILELEDAGALPVGSYHDIIIKVCETAGCPIE